MYLEWLLECRLILCILECNSLHQLIVQCVNSLTHWWVHLECFNIIDFCIIDFPLSMKLLIIGEWTWNDWLEDNFYICKCRFFPLVRYNIIINIFSLIINYIFYVFFFLNICFVLFFDFFNLIFHLSLISKFIKK